MVPPRPPSPAKGTKRHGLGERHHPRGADRRALRLVRQRALADVRGDEGREPGARRPGRGRWLHRHRDHLRHHVPVLLSFVIVVPVMAALGYALQRTLIQSALDRSVLTTLIVTFGLSVVIENGLLQFFSANTRGIGVGL